MLVCNQQSPAFICYQMMTCDMMCPTFSHIELHALCPGAVASQWCGPNSDRVISWTEVRKPNTTLGLIHRTRDALVFLSLKHTHKQNRRKPVRDKAALSKNKTKLQTLLLLILYAVNSQKIHGAKTPPSLSLINIRTQHRSLGRLSSCNHMSQSKWLVPCSNCYFLIVYSCLMSK